jgi:hypothetical protein
MSLERQTRQRGSLELTIDIPRHSGQPLHVRLYQLRKAL